MGQNFLDLTDTLIADHWSYKKIMRNSEVGGMIKSTVIPYRGGNGDREELECGVLKEVVKVPHVGGIERYKIS